MIAGDGLFKMKINGQEIIAIDVTDLDIRYFPVYKKLNKWQKAAYRRQSAVNQKKKSRKFKKYLGSIYRRIQPSIYKFLVSNPGLPRNAESARLIDEHMRKEFPTLMALYDMRIK